MTTEQMLAESLFSLQLAILAIPSIILFSILIATLVSLPYEIKNYFEKQRRLKRLEALDKSKKSDRNFVLEKLFLARGIK